MTQSVPFRVSVSNGWIRPSAVALLWTLRYLFAALWRVLHAGAPSLPRFDFRPQRSCALATAYRVRGPPSSGGAVM